MSRLLQPANPKSQTDPVQRALFDCKTEYRARLCSLLADNAKAAEAAAARFRPYELLVLEATYAAMSTLDIPGLPDEMEQERLASKLPKPTGTFAQRVAWYLEYLEGFENDLRLEGIRLLRRPGGSFDDEEFSAEALAQKLRSMPPAESTGLQLILEAIRAVPAVVTRYYDWGNPRLLFQVMEDPWLDWQEMPFEDCGITL